MTNFDFLKNEPRFSGFADVAISAEKLLHIDPEASIFNCRRAMEFAIKWMYSVDDSLEMPYRDTLSSMMSSEEFHELIDDRDLWRRMEFIRKQGNNVAHQGKKVSVDVAELCLENLYYFMDFIACCYSEGYVYRPYDKKLLKREAESEKSALVPSVDAMPDIDLKALIEENKALRAELTARREEKKQTYVPKPLDLSEYKTRKLYIDTMLMDAGWVEGSNWINEVPVTGMPNKSGTGRVDYVLYDDAHKPLALVEAKSSCMDVSKGRQQAKLYADALERQYKRRPVIFLTNGFDTRIVDGKYPERKVAGIYSKRDLEKWFNLLSMRESLESISVNKKIAGRYYQEGAVRAVCDSFGRKNRRKALLVMATGSGKTRTVIALCDVLLKKGWVKNILFLADRNSLVTQAKRSFVNLLPDLSVVNLCEDKTRDLVSLCIFHVSDHDELH